MTTLLRLFQITYGICLAVNYLALAFFWETYTTGLATLISPDGTFERPLITLILIQTALFVPLYALLHAQALIGYIGDFPKLPTLYKTEIALIFSFILFYLLSMIFSSIDFYTEDGIFENITASFVLAGTGFLLFSIPKLNLLQSRLVILLAALGFFFFGMEEISWGQRIIGWETPQSWAEANYQEETNLHNLLNPVLHYVIFVLNLLIGACIIFIHHLEKFFDRALEPAFFKRNRHFFALLFFSLAVQSLLRDSELMEEVLSAIILVRSIAIYRNVKNSALIEFA